MYSSRASFVKMPARTSCIFLATRGGSAKVFRLAEPPPAPDRRRLEDVAAAAFLPLLDGDFLELLGEAGSSASRSSSASARAFSPLWIW